MLIIGRKIITAHNTCKCTIHKQTQTCTGLGWKVHCIMYTYDCVDEQMRVHVCMCAYTCATPPLLLFPPTWGTKMVSMSPCCFLCRFWNSSIPLFLYWLTTLLVLWIAWCCMMSLVVVICNMQFYSYHLFMSTFLVKYLNSQVLLNADANIDSLM